MLRERSPNVPFGRVFNDAMCTCTFYMTQEALPVDISVFQEK